MAGPRFPSKLREPLRVALKEVEDPSLPHDGSLWDFSAHPPCCWEMCQFLQRITEVVMTNITWSSLEGFSIGVCLTVLSLIFFSSCWHVGVVVFCLPPCCCSPLPQMVFLQRHRHFPLHFPPLLLFEVGCSCGEIFLKLQVEGEIHLPVFQVKTLNSDGQEGLQPCQGQSQSQEASLGRPWKLADRLAGLVV